MTVHRFADQLLHTQPAYAAAATSAFMPCPVFTLFSPTHQAFVEQVYRVAAEHTREQLQPKREFPPAFSPN